MEIESEGQIWEGEQIRPDATFFDLPGDHVRRYIFASDYVKGRIVLDDCCGAGYGTRYLRDSGCELIIGADRSEEAIRFATTHYQGDGVLFTRQDATELAFQNNQFDVIVSFEAIEHIREYPKYVAEICRCLKEEGLYIMSTPNKLMTSPVWRTPYNPWHVQEFRPAEMSSLLGRYFYDVELLGQHSLNEKWNTMEHRYKFANYIHPYLLRWIPRRLKDTYLGLSLSNERVRYTDWVIDDEDIEHSYCLVGLCRRPRKEMSIENKTH